MTLHEYDVVRLRRDMTEHGLRAGAVGAIVMIFYAPRAYEVEFCDGDGRTLALVTLAAEDLDKITPDSKSGL